MTDGRKTGEDLRPIMGPYFWQVMLVAPSCSAVGITALQVARRGGASTDGLGICVAEGFLASILSVASAQCPLHDLWSKYVEGDLGMPRWVHRCAGALEAVIVVLRAHGGASCGGWLPVAGLDSAATSPAGARESALAHFLVSGLMGGALWTWPFGVQIREGLAPGLLVLSASAFATEQRLQRAAPQLAQGERWLWHLAALGAMMTGAASAAILFDPKRRAAKRGEK
mmetsp:Transcript_14631/g.42116  ORF Transcript_14631/g.42116 Transcript_14631/m.42116 type:complete len:227 (-) Transcript_14631:105-785(-)